MFLTRETGVSIKPRVGEAEPQERVVESIQARGAGGSRFITIDVNRNRYRPLRGLNYLFGGLILGPTLQALCFRVLRRLEERRRSRFCFSRRLLSWTL